MKLTGKTWAIYWLGVATCLLSLGIAVYLPIMQQPEDASRRYLEIATWLLYLVNAYYAIRVARKWFRNSRLVWLIRKIQ